MTALVSLLFITMIPIDCKITIFPYTCEVYVLPNIVLYLIQNAFTYAVSVLRDH